MRRATTAWCGVGVAGVSLSLWLASLWVVSYRDISGRAGVTVALVNGELWVTTGSTYFRGGLSAFHEWPRLESFRALRWWPADRWFERSVVPGIPAWWSVKVPLWVPLVAGLGLTVAAARRWRRRRGVCDHCEYELRDLARCPECGRPVNPPPGPSPR